MLNVVEIPPDPAGVLLAFPSDLLSYLPSSRLELFYTESLII